MIAIIIIDPIIDIRRYFTSVIKLSDKVKRYSLTRVHGPLQILF